MDLTARTLLLRLNDQGEPVTASSYGQGVLTLPSLPLPKNSGPNTPLYTLKLLIAAGCPVARDGLVWTNVPEKAGVDFDRNQFHKIVIKTSFHRDDEISIPIYKPGTFCFYLSFRNDQEQLETTRKFYFVVLPCLFNNTGELLPLNSIALQSVVSKWLGPTVKDWDCVFKKISKKKYNMIHFTPLQERGESNSPYSIYDQLKFDPEHFKSADDVAKMVNHLYKDYNILSMTDIVFNHTANNSKWLLDHPDAGYNEITAPHLTGAIELDKSLLDFSKNLKNYGYPTLLNNEDDLIKIMDGIKIHVLGSLRLWEFYVMNVKFLINDFEKNWELKSTEKILPENIPEFDGSDDSIRKLAVFLVQNATNESFHYLGTRYAKTLILEKAIAILKASLIEGEKSDKWNNKVENLVQRILDEINLPLYKEYDDDVNEILEQLFNRIKYLRIDDNGPKQGEINDKLPLTEPYFTRFIGTDGESYALANNGWIWDGNPLVDFASNKSKAYIRREVIVWGDCVKLRYGSGPQDSPYLWERMSKYVEMSAKIFNGFRIDNCHSTPLHVGEYFLDLARRVNPNLYVVAELFTGSEMMDCLFVERLGISSLIREAMQSWSEEELSRLVHKHGGRPIESFKFVPMDNFPYPADIKIDEEYCKYNEDDHAVKCVSEIMIPKILTATPPHALFMDCTHDNEMPYQKRTVEDTLPNAALVALCSSAIGSVYGYDEIFPNLLNLVTESRTYEVKDCDGISEIKTKLFEIRDDIAKKSLDIEDSEMHVHHEGQYITFHRSDAKTGSGWYLIARMKFNNNVGEQVLPPVVLSQSKCSLKFAYTLEKTGDYKDTESTTTIKGIPTKLRELTGFGVNYNEASQTTTITTPGDFPPGSIAIFRTQQNGVDDSLDHFIRSGAIKATSNLTLESLNYVLYRCENEERDYSHGQGGCYDIPGYGKLVYAGLQGWISVFRDIVFSNDLAHPLAANLRDGEWALDYVVNRLSYYQDTPGVKDVQDWLRSRLDRVRKLPNFLRPSYFALIIGILYGCCRLRAMQLMSINIGKSTVFIQSLAMTSIQMISRLNSTSIYPDKQVPCMAAGLPHFSTDYMRCWGRDVFISLRGLLLTTGRYDLAKHHILAFAKTLKHGLIPNLLDAGRNPRYNARDAAWFFVQAIQDYVHIVPNGEDILKEKITRRFPLNDEYVTCDDPKAFAHTSTIAEIIYEILIRHAAGIKYREANAGPNLDRVMKDEGFNVEVHVDWNTGLIHGGSQSNCGTWMDKMGESDKAGSTGVPGTPRDGAAVEINGLLKSCLRFVNELHAKGLFKFTDVTTQDGKKVTLKQWNQLVQDNFEKKFYVPEDPKDDAKYDVDPNIVNRRGIYKDLYRSGKPYEDYQLRPNFAIAMVVAPELFTPEYATKAINIADKAIRGPVGMCTLDPSDYNYRPYYNNGEDSDDFATSKGRNYHQGPEWVWCTGYFLRAFLHFNFTTDPRACNEPKTKPSSYMYQQLYYRLVKHREWITNSPWAGLTELSNKNGEICNDSSPTQAWSSGCLLDLFYDVWTDFEEDDASD